MQLALETAMRQGAYLGYGIYNPNPRHSQQRTLKKPCSRRPQPCAALATATELSMVRQSRWYVDRGTEHRSRTEPWESDITTPHDPAKVEWAEQMTGEVPLPTTWNKQELEQAPATEVSR